MSGQSTEVPMDIEPKEDAESEEKTSGYAKLLENGVPVKIAAKLDILFKSGKISFEDLDERAFLALKEFPIEETLVVLNQFVNSNFEHVSNKSAFLCSMIKLRQKHKEPGNIPAPVSGNMPSPVPRNMPGNIPSPVSKNIPSPVTSNIRSLVPENIPSLIPKGPDEEKIKEIVERTGYSMDVTAGQRKYGGPPPDWKGPDPGIGCEVFCGNIPREIFEDDLILLFEKYGKIFDLRLMMDPITGLNKGFAFITYTTTESAKQAVRDLDNHEIRPGKKLRVNITVPNLRLFIGNLPKTKGKDEIMEQFGKLTVGLVNVIIYSPPDGKSVNRGFCFLEYESHKAASIARKKLGRKPVRVWNCDIMVDWADPLEEPDEEIMSRVKVLYVRNLKSEFTEVELKNAFGAFGEVSRVKKLKDYAFIHFEEREKALAAMNELNGKEFYGNAIEITWAKPPTDKRKKEELLRNREKRMGQLLYSRGMVVPRYGLRSAPRGSPRGQMPMSYGTGYYDEDYGYGGGQYGGGYGGNAYYDEYGSVEYPDEFYCGYQPARMRDAPRSRMGGMRMQPMGGRSGMRGLARCGIMAGRSPRGYGPPGPRGRHLRAPAAVGAKRKFGAAVAVGGFKRRQARSRDRRPLAEPLEDSDDSDSDDSDSDDSDSDWLSAEDASNSQ